MSDYTVIFQPSGRRGKVAAGTTIVQASRKLGVEIETICGEKQMCGKCKVKVEDSGARSSMGHLSQWSAEEDRFISPDERAQGYRLGCAARIFGDVLIYVPEESRASVQVVRKEARPIDFALDPAVKRYTAALPESTFQDPMADLERICRALKSEYGLSDLRIDHRALSRMSRMIRDCRWDIAVLVWDDKEIIDIQPGTGSAPLGLALDIGTTTVAGYLCDLTTGELLATASMMNPQVKYGEDVMSRITYAMTHPGEGLERMKTEIVEGINRIVSRVASSCDRVPENIYDMTVVGNTCMHHIFLGIDPGPLGMSPFTPAIHHSVDIKARDLGVRIHPGAYVHVLPIEAGFVGADNVGVLICEEPYLKDDMTLIIDIGTNGELILGNRERLFSSSCATGPALEGAQITFGMRAAPGAIERIRIDPSTLEVDYKLVDRELWNSESDPAEMQAKGICGSGILDVLAELFRAEIIEKSGAFNPNLKNSRFRRGEGGQPEFVIAWEAETSIGRDITVTQKDIRQIQLAKGALYTGAKLMMRRMGVRSLDRVVLAGGFGSYVDPGRALAIGMFPDGSVNSVQSVGNAAGDGARLALLSRAKRHEADRVARQVEYMELTIEPDFQEQFIESLHIPHMKDQFPSLSTLDR
ncbi:MAG: DUF4445 domain-containing protein [Deltaproteobacteria bacterium]|nr:DUF4445 domain-containing protein [Deltaproteobacteria bacterium]